MEAISNNNNNNNNNNESERESESENENKNENESENENNHKIRQINNCFKTIDKWKSFGEQIKLFKI